MILLYVIWLRQLSPFSSKPVLNFFWLKSSLQALGWEVTTLKQKQEELENAKRPGKLPNPSRQMRTGVKGRPLDLWLGLTRDIGPNISKSWQENLNWQLDTTLAWCDFTFFCIYGNPKKDGTTIVYHYVSMVLPFDLFGRCYTMHIWYIYILYIYIL